MVRLLLAAAGAAALAACAPVGPNYRLPSEALVNAPAAQGGFVSGNGGTAYADLPDRWWRLYDDATLDALVGQALDANTDLRAANANLARSMALLDEARTHREVQGGASAETDWQQRSAEQVLSHVQPPERQTYDVGLSASYDLDLFGGIRRGIEAVTADSEASEAARDLVRVTVAAETARAYADICNAGYRLAALQRVIAVQEDDLRLTRLLVAHGRAASFEADRHVAALDASRARLPGLAARQRNAAFRLATLLGRPPAQYDPEWLRCAAPLRLSQPLPTGDGRALLARRPDIRMAERHLAADTARIGVATSALYPDIRLGASIGSTGAAIDALSPLTNRFAIGPLITWTLNRSAARARIAGVRAQTDADLANFDGSVLKALREVEIALDTYGADLDRQRELERSRIAAQSVAARTRQLRAGGRIGGLAALSAERDAALAEQAAADGEADLNADQIAVFLALGGGWKAPEAGKSDPTHP